MLMVVAIQCVSGQSAADGLTERFPKLLFLSESGHFLPDQNLMTFFIPHLVTFDKWIIG